MAQLLDIFGFLAVVLRALTLAFGAVAVGGVVFDHFVLRKTGSRLISTAALALAATQVFYLFANSEILSSTIETNFADLIGASYFMWGCVIVVAALVLATLAMKRAEHGLPAIVCSLAIITATTATSHSAARLDHRATLMLATAAHQAATAAWIGGLPFLLIALRKEDNTSRAETLLRSFSALAMCSVAVLLAAGLLLATFYVGSVQALYGTTYGVMLVSKVILFALVILFGAFNYKLVRQLRSGDRSLLVRLRRFGEAEIGIGITAILAAASLTSQPPGVDLVNDRVTWSMITTRMTPHAPRMTTPPLSSLTPSQRQTWNQQHPATSSNSTFIPGQTYVIPTQGDIQWSEYNHHWSGFVVLVIGVLAVLSRFKHARWARHWPLAFLGLALFLFLRSDPENWPLGPDGFWEGFAAAEVAQHRFFVLLIILFAAFEWGIQTGRLSSKKAALVFPLVCAVGGAMLLTHTHSLANIKEELLAELSHVPLAIFAVAAGWARWLELRLPGPGTAIAGRVWPVCFVLIGAILLLYREA